MSREPEVNFISFGPAPDAKPDIVAVGEHRCPDCGFWARPTPNPYLISVVTQCACGTEIEIVPWEAGRD